MTASDDTRGEPRLPVVITLLVAMAVPLLMPDALLPGPRWLFPVIIAALMVAEIAVDPGRIDRRSQQAHWVRLGLVAVLLGSSVWSTAVLADGLIYGQSGFTESAAELLRSGALVWVEVVIAFTFLFWELDAGGPGERAHVEHRHPDFAFPQDLNPEVKPESWRPTFVDYLYVGITNGSAFSPTDTMPLTHWAKLSMAVQSLTSLVILGLVVARAVNILN